MGGLVSGGGTEPASVLDDKKASLICARRDCSVEFSPSKKLPDESALISDATEFCHEEPSLGPLDAIFCSCAIMTSPPMNLGGEDTFSCCSPLGWTKRSLRIVLSICSSRSFDDDADDDDDAPAAFPFIGVG